MVREFEWKRLDDLSEDLALFVGRTISDFSVVDHYGLTPEEIIEKDGSLGNMNGLSKDRLIDRWGFYWIMDFADGTTWALTHVSFEVLYGKIDKRQLQLANLAKARILDVGCHIYSVMNFPELAGQTTKSIIGQVVKKIKLLKFYWPPDPSSSSVVGTEGWGGIEILFESGYAVCLGPSVANVPNAVFASDFIIKSNELDSSIIIEQMEVQARETT